MLRDKRWPWISLALVAAGLILAGTALTALAQCGENPPSSCLTCHEKTDPVLDNGEWHQIHARKDICVNCHGGNALAPDKAQAHLGMVAQPLGDTYLSCHSCHPDDYPTRAAQFGAQLGVTPQSERTPTPCPTGVASGQTVIVLPTPASLTPLISFTPASVQLVWPVLLAVVALALMAWIALGWRRASG
jgi:hypothetical protein